MDNTLVFLDEGFLDKLTKNLGNGKRLKFNKISFAEKLSSKQNLRRKHLFYYTAPPFQGTPPTKREQKMKEGYDRFIHSLSKSKNITIRQGRCQKLVSEEGKSIYNQKGVDTLLTIDLSHIKEDFPDIKEVILVSSDTDFCPAIRDIKSRANLDVILYSYFDKRRNSKFSVSNELIQCCSKFIQLSKQDFLDSPLEEKIK